MNQLRDAFAKWPPLVQVYVVTLFVVTVGVTVHTIVTQNELKVTTVLAVILEVVYVLRRVL